MRSNQWNRSHSLKLLVKSQLPGLLIWRISPPSEPIFHDPVGSNPQIKLNVTILLPLFGPPKKKNLAQPDEAWIDLGSTMSRLRSAFLLLLTSVVIISIYTVVPPCRSVASAQWSTEDGRSGLGDPDSALSFETRTDILCPNNCSESECNSVGVCECDSHGADCSFHVEQCDIILGQQVIRNRVPGDVVELGVFKGGSASVLVNVFQYCTSKKFWLYDSYAGHPEIDEQKNPGMSGFTRQHVGTLEEAKNNVHAINPDVDNTKLIWKKVFFNETLNQTLPHTIAYLHIDCDWYECYVDILNRLYDRVAWGGVVVLDDVGYYGFAKAGVMAWMLSKKMVYALRSSMK